MRFLVDMPLSPALAQRLVDAGHDAVHASDLGLASAEDVDVLRHARNERRIVVTADLDYPRLLALGASVDPGLILFRGGDWGEREVADRMQQILAASDAEALVNCVLVVERGRVRRRRLPLR